MESNDFSDTAAVVRLTYDPWGFGSWRTLPDTALGFIGHHFNMTSTVLLVIGLAWRTKE